MLAREIGSVPPRERARRLRRMSFMKRKSEKADIAQQRQLEDELRERALRLVDTRGVVVREAEAALHAALADQRSYATPERAARVAEATRALEEAKASLRSSRT